MERVSLAPPSPGGQKAPGVLRREVPEYPETPCTTTARCIVVESFKLSDAPPIRSHTPGLRMLRQNTQCGIADICRMEMGGISACDEITYSADRRHQESGSAQVRRAAKVVPSDLEKEHLLRRWIGRSWTVSQLDAHWLQVNRIASLLSQPVKQITALSDPGQGSLCSAGEMTRLMREGGTADCIPRHETSCCNKKTRSVQGCQMDSGSHKGRILYKKKCRSSR